MPPGMALIVILRGSNYRCLEQIFMVPKGFEPSKFDCIWVDADALEPKIPNIWYDVCAKHNVTHRILCKDVLRSLFVTCDFRVLTIEFYWVFVFAFCVSLFKLCVLPFKECNKGHKRKWGETGTVISAFYMLHFKKSCTFYGKERS